MKSGLRRLGLPTDGTPVPIISLTIGSRAHMQQIQSALMERGIAIAYFGPYSGLGADGGLRIAVFSTHTEAMIDRLVEEIGRVI